ncbi:MAG: bifunctional riboflavin kinase/FAD synthetase [Verrucomicrobiae bacterium]|nr:bifunctional riboflavin kinase/FAD synthetase [Verrucomicrobiae bacterium]
MRLYRNLKELGRNPRPIVLAVGVFDGVHLGHQAVIRKAARLAMTTGSDAGMLTFHPHPAKVLRPRECPPLLTTEMQDIELFSSFGADFTLVMDFTPGLARIEPRAFLDRLHRCVPMLRGVVVGPRWRFGRDRDGDFTLLHQWAALRAIETIEVPAVEVEGHAVSSTAIRRLIAKGNIKAANARLGRPYQIVGRVEPGDALGRKMGIPTANLHVENEVLPAKGVYAARVLVEGEVFAAAVNVGTRPTVKTGGAMRVEAHLIDFSGDLYGYHLRVDLIERLRGEKKFPDTTSLSSQILLDLLAAAKLAHD